jgi:hypothetical protein
MPVRGEFLNTGRQLLPVGALHSDQTNWVVFFLEEFMSVSTVTNDTTSSQTTWRSTAHQAKQDFNALFQAMANNDISGAQQAYAAIQQLQSSLTPASSSASTATTAATGIDPLSTVKTDWSSLGQALQSGSLSTAQQVFSQLGQDALAVQQARKQQVAATTSTLQNDIQSLNQALQSGDTTSAQKLLAQLEQDLQNSRMAFGHHHHGSASSSATATVTPASTTASTGTASA